ncbi:uncharacterized protein PAC_11711 [Phialocephala subalpina]|uniref:BTB domain-containing protein n=1 Tax=Phialocephala subalpina TaxID=576137 RepID=A0A1L7X9W3_9HELO|nr:uncharacterized protein PAC_11711 [Phialocephala subalpina]
MATKRKLPWTDRGESSKRPNMSFASAVTNSCTFSNRSSSESPFMTPRVSGAMSASSASHLDFSTPQKFVTIHVGSSTEPFTIHKNIITHYSPFFSTAFNGQYFEGKTQSMKFEDGDIDILTFGTFVNWLYTQRAQNSSGDPLNLIEYAKLYTLFERFLIPDMTKSMLRYIEEVSPDEEYDSGNALHDFQEFAYGASGDDKLKHIAVVKTMLAMKKDNEDDLIENMPAAMMKDFTKSLMIGCVSLKGWEKGDAFAGVKSFKSPLRGRDVNIMSESPSYFSGRPAYSREPVRTRRSAYGGRINYDAIGELFDRHVVPSSTQGSSEEEEGEVWAEPEIEEGVVSEPEDNSDGEGEGEGDEEEPVIKFYDSGEEEEYDENAYNY